MRWSRRKESKTKGHQGDPGRHFLRTLASSRLTLVAADAEVVKADLRGRKELAELLRADVPENWPPDLYGRVSLEHALLKLKDPAERGWTFWYLLTSTEREPQVIGICGFKSRPDVTGSVEISYSVLQQFRNRGLATEAVGQLVRWAFSHQNVVEVSAETVAHLRQSIRVMEKNGFSYTGMGSERGVVRYAVRRPDRR